MPYLCQSLRSLHEKQIKLEALLDVHSAVSRSASAHSTLTPAHIKSAKTSHPVTPHS
jgi:hypothetical protein